MPEAVILIGAQASGKSSFCKQRLFATHLRINLDMLRTRSREAKLLHYCIATKLAFVVDNTNPTCLDRQRYLAQLKSTSFNVTGYYFQSEIAACLARNKARPAGEQIPEVGIRGTHAELQIPQWDEGFDALYYVRVEDSGRFSVEAWQQ